MKSIYKIIMFNNIQINFLIENDWRDFIKYQKLIGKKTIFNLINFVAKKANKNIVNYHHVSVLLIYEKRIKRCFFKYMQLLEDNVKSMVIDNMYFKHEGDDKGRYVKFSNGEYDSNDFSALNELHRISDKSIDHNRMIKIMESLLDNQIITHKYFVKLEKCYDLRNWMLHFNSMYVNNNFSIIQESLEYFASAFPSSIKWEYEKTIDDCKKDLIKNNSEMSETLFLKNFTQT